MGPVPLMRPSLQPLGFGHLSGGILLIWSSLRLFGPSLCLCVLYEGGNGTKRERRAVV